MDVTDVGFKYHMNNVTATIGLVELAHVGAVIAQHPANGRHFDGRWTGSTAWSFAAGTRAPSPPTGWTVPVDDRGEVVGDLAAHGIAASQAHRRNDRHSVFAATRCELPGLDAWFARYAHIPCGWWVDDAQREYIVDVIRRGRVVKGAAK